MTTPKYSEEPNPYVITLTVRLLRCSATHTIHTGIQTSLLWEVKMKPTDLERAIRNAVRNEAMRPVLAGAAASGQALPFTQTDLESAAKSLVERLAKVSGVGNGEKAEAGPWI